MHLILHGHSTMDSRGSSSLNITNNSFGDNVTIYQGNIQNPAADQTDQCLKDLRPTDPRDDKTRIQQTKGGLLEESLNWIFENETFKRWRDDEENTVLWIKGDPGKGKTMLLCGIIDKLMPTTKLAKPMNRTSKTFLSYFFCQGTDSRINNATAVLRGLIYLVIIQEPSLISHIQERYSHAGKDLFLDTNAWIALSDMLQRIIHDPKVGDIVLVLDALEECETDLAKLLDLITHYASLPHVKWIISSRNILSIQQRLEPFILQGILSLELKANAEEVSKAVDIYIEHRVSHLRSIQHNRGQRDGIRDALRQKANGTFLWVSLAVKELEDVQSWEMMEVVKEMPVGLTAVYRRMIHQIRDQRRGRAEFCWKILSTIFTAYYPLSLGELGILSGLSKEISEHLESVTKLVTLCSSFLTIRQGIVYFIHQSAKEFLSTEAFQSDGAQRHAHIYEQSISAISTLPQNIYGLPDSGFRSKNVPPPETNPLAPMRYSCFCWIDHFCDAYGANLQREIRLALKEKLWSFLKDYVLRWLESIALLGRLPDALRSIQKIIRESRLDMNSQLSKFLQSTEKFIINNGSIIDRAPLQVYGSALVFSQTSSDIKQQQWKERLPLIQDIKGTVITNSALFQTLEGHSCIIEAICFSPDSKMIASCCNAEIRVWDAAIGATKHTFLTGSRSMSAISFSPDCKSLMFVFSHVHSINGSRISLVAVSLNSNDPSIQLHNSTKQSNDAGAHRRSQVLKRRHVGKVLPVVAKFSLDGTLVAITERDGPIELWNTATGVYLKAFQRSQEQITFFSAISFSPDSKMIASAHADGAVKLWDIETGACFRTFMASCFWIFAIAFRLDDKKLALGLGGNIQLLDITTGKIQKSHLGSVDYQIRAIAFSPDSKIMASGCDDNTIRLWKADVGIQPWTTEDTYIGSSRSETFGTILKMVLSPDGKILAALNLGNTKIGLWDTTKGTLQNVFKISIEGTGICAIAFSLHGRTLALGCDGIWLWDTATGHHIHHPTLTSYYRPTCTAIAFSPNGEELASSIGGIEIQLYNTATGEIQKEFSLKLGNVLAITFLPDGKTLAAAYDVGSILLWDAATATCLHAIPYSVFPWCKDLTSIMTLPNGPFVWLGHRYVINWLQGMAELLKHDLLSVDGEWITKGGKHLLWLSREYRIGEAGLIAIQANTVAIGHASGVTFLRFNS
ncbi:hypothetical protein GGI35DRAFT_453391 [Trichoderma velutinum]